ncbi:MAG: membrane protein insertase YidC [Armatimonadia bacterium]|nr:membrane protein insertase YidC [Armatimonadia bacterium]
MSSHVKSARTPGHTIALVVLALVCSCTLGPAQSATVPQSQEGLPVDLVIEAEPPLKEQLTNMETLYAEAVKDLPEGGLINSIKGVFAGNDEEQPNYAPVGYLSKYAARVRGDLVESSGIWYSGDSGGVLRSMGYEIDVEFAGDTEPEGFDAVDGVDGMPALVVGRIETEGEAALLRADSVTPSGLVSGVRIGRIKELQEDWEGAVEAYEDVANQGPLGIRPLAAFARTRAGKLALEKLDDEKRARDQYAAAWEAFTKEVDGQPAYWIWVPSEEGGWEAISAKEALAEPLNELNSHKIAYRIVDLFVRISGGSPAFGVILMAVVVRLAIYPLTKKQIVSQKRMQAIQPQIKELQKEHATDKQKFQEEFWALCQENDCNPLGGCLPMLVQMPILIFLYRGIHDYIVQFEGVSFLWVPNLAEPNMILLILYTLSMVAFQKMAAKSQPTADPQQKQQQQMMAYMMPLMFFFFFQSFPAAFLLYWLGSNVIYFGEQAIFMRGGPESLPEKGEGEKKKKSGFVGSMLDAAKRMGGEDEDEENEPPMSYAEKLKQEKSKKRGKGR